MLKEPVQARLDATVFRVADPQGSKSLIYPPLAEALLFANHGEPALNPKALARAWSWMRPWRGLRTVENGGGAPGAYSYILRREDKLCFAMVVNFEYVLGREPLVSGPQYHGLNLHDWYGQLNTIADTLNEAGTWPDVDLFPSVGRPPLV